MSNDWPDGWVSATQKMSSPRARFTNDNGIRCLIGDTPEEYLFVKDVPAELDLRQ